MNSDEQNRENNDIKLDARECSERLRRGLEKWRSKLREALELQQQRQSYSDQENADATSQSQERGDRH